MKLLEEEDVKSDKNERKKLSCQKIILVRSILYLAVLSEACKVLLDHPLMNGELSQASIPDGRTTLYCCNERKYQYPKVHF